MDKPIKTDSPIMGNCLSCQGLVRVPATAPTSSTVKCPHCDESFRLSQILNHAVPALKIVEENEDDEDDSGEFEVNKDADGRFVVANQLRQSSKKSRRARRKRSRRPEETEGMVPVPKTLGPVGPESEFSSDPIDRVEGKSQFAVDDSESKSSRESFDSRRSRSSSGGRSSRSSRSSSDSSRSRSRSSSSGASGSNAAVEIFKVAFGGALAIPIAYLLVLWVFKQDPLHVAPKIVNTAPFLVPAVFHLEDEERPAINDGDSSYTGLSETERQSVEDVLDVSNGLPKPRRDPGKVGIN